MKSILALIATVACLPTFAQAAPKAVVTCKTPVGVFKVTRSTSKPGLVGQWAGEKTAYSCKAAKTGADSSIRMQLTCIENRAGEGRKIVNLQNGGIVGATQLQEGQEQIFPLPPAVGQTYICQ